ncbi:hypothetical protein [Roseovarius salis]|uniref:hypothetical protein n=1 Tax=Roseovarius salis TaxID=3376063 RepID=UPI0037CB1C02
MSRPRKWARTGAFLAVALAGPGLAGTDFSDLTAAERAIFRQEIREVLLTVPRLLPDTAPRRAPDAQALYADEIEADLARIRAHSDALFSPERPGFGARDATQTVALFIAADCAACANAKSALKALAASHDLRVTLHDMDERADLAAALGLDMAPSYVFPDMMVRGAVPPIVLERYLGN